MIYPDIQAMWQTQLTNYFDRSLLVMGREGLPKEMQAGLLQKLRYMQPDWRRLQFYLIPCCKCY